jgi:hypothetical protein
MSGIAGAAPGGDSTSGNVLVGTNRLDWNARSTATGFNARGNARFTVTASDPNQVYSGEVTCLRIVGATPTSPALASIGVLVTQAPPGSFVSSMIIFASDNGKSSPVPDTATVGLSSGPPPADGACPAPFAGAPVSTGEVVINNELP